MTYRKSLHIISSVGGEQGVSYTCMYILCSYIHNKVYIIHYVAIRRVCENDATTDGIHGRHHLRSVKNLHFTDIS